MNPEEFENVLRKTISPGKSREALIGSEVLSDVTFILGNQQEELKAHTFFLSTASPVLHEIFSREYIDDETGFEIRVSDITKSTMIEICRYAYSENVRFNQHNMIDILAAATKLRMNFLAEKAVNFIGKEGLNEATVFNVLEKNQKEKNTIIDMKCFAYIEKNHQKCFKASEFLSISSDTFRLILKACKLPQTVAKEAIALWSAHLDNGSDDLDELLALTKKLKTHGFAYQLDASNGSDDLDEVLVLTKKTTHDFVYQLDASNKQAKTTKKTTAPAPTEQIHSLFFDGTYTMKTFQLAVLNLSTTTKPVSINELEFISGSDKSDNELVLAINDITGSANTSLWTTVLKKESSSGEFTRCKLGIPCEVAAGKQIRVTITFKTNGNRKSLDINTLMTSSTQSVNALILCPSPPTFGQIILRIGYICED